MEGGGRHPAEPRAAGVIQRTADSFGGPVRFAVAQLQVSAGGLPVVLGGTMFRSAQFGFYDFALRSLAHLVCPALRKLVGPKLRDKASQKLDPSVQDWLPRLVPWHSSSRAAKRQALKVSRAGATTKANSCGWCHGWLRPWCHRGTQASLCNISLHA